MFFWIIYLTFSLTIAFLFSMLVKKRLLKFLLFFISLGLLSAIWFKNPGSSEIAPVISIFFLENTILENQGIMRLIRPLSLFALIGFITSILFWIFKSKN